MSVGYAKSRDAEIIESELDTEEVAAQLSQGTRLAAFFVAVHAALDAKTATGDTILEKIASLEPPA